MKPKYKTQYRCEFEFMGGTRVAISSEGIADFKDGFWINADLQFTKGSDCKYWILPHRIMYIAKDSVAT